MNQRDADFSEMHSKAEQDQMSILETKLSKLKKNRKQEVLQGDLTENYLDLLLNKSDNEILAEHLTHENVEPLERT